MRTKSMFLKIAKFVVIQFVLATLFFLPASAQNFTLTSNGDTHAVTPATSALDAGGQITLRSAVEAATQWSLGGSHIITIPAAIGATINLTIAGQMTVGSASNNSITINGPGKSLLTINQTQPNRIFSTTTQIFTFVLTDLTLNQTYVGATTFTGGGGALIAGGPVGTSTTLTNVAITNFTMQAGSGGGMSASFSQAHNLTVTNCDFTGNKCGAAGGGLSFNSGGGTLTVTNSRFTNNSTGVVGASSGSSGGAINTSGQGTGGTYFITQNTFIGNQVTNPALGIGGGAIVTTNGISTVNFNRFINNTAATATNGNTLYEAGGGTVGFQNINADNNWWGVNSGPGPNDLSVVNGVPAGVITLTKWLQLKSNASPNSVCGNGAATVTSGFLSNNNNDAIAQANLTALVALPISFVNPALGTLSGAQATIQASGTATVTYTAGVVAGAGSVNAVVDNVPNNDLTAKASITINPPITVTNPVTTTGTVGTAFNQTFTQSGGSLPVSFTLNSGALPAGITLSTAGVLSGIPTQVGSFPITVKVTDNNGCTGIGASYNLVISCQAIAVTNPATTTGTNGTAFSQTFTQSGGTLPVTFSLNSGTLPTGLTLSAAGVLSGTPTQTGSFPITVKVTDANACTGTGPSYNLNIAPPPGITATLRDAITVDNFTPGVANPTDQVTYTGIIKNTSGSTITAVSTTLPLPTNTGSPSGVTTSALARNDSYTAFYNTALSGNNVTANDYGLPSVSVVSYGTTASLGTTTSAGGTGASNNGGTVVITDPLVFLITPV